MPRSASSAVDKALDLIEAVALAARPLRLGELAQAVGLHRATAYRVLLDLVARGWVLRVGEHYLPGGAALRVSRAAAAGSLAALAHPVLARLAEATAMMVNLQVLEADRSRVVGAVRPPRLQMISDLLGEALPVHRFAGPLALVACLEAAAREPYLAAAREAGYPLDGPHGLLADLDRARADGYALERGRNDKLIASISRAVVSAQGAPLCALTVVGPDAEFDDARVARLRERLAEATAELYTILTTRTGDGSPS
ncbi:IclR family transcriptional regulator [Catellatospora sp. TT07R-123]|uniref:IclR family transcriptional regulator n=1 Tax=Catellatospora sp. TT07R-123 TaxID=2733863 RepID=UPI001AFF3794|nr:helix-turn-helix domain-containing protein [Catellatospora sp. TT07R-123]GHJ44045.1 IclR family transcriptional regulator [Catellatospora sp. TT07R-123]